MNTRPWHLVVPLALALCLPALAEEQSAAGGSGVLGGPPPSMQDDDVISASNPGPYRPELLLLLSHVDRDPRPEELEAMGPDVGDELRSIVEDERVLRLARVRAVAALAELGDDASFEAVASVARSADAHPRLRIVSLWAIGHRFEGREGREAILASALSEPDHGLRLHAVQSLAEIGSEEAMRIIDEHRIAERHVTVRELLRELREREIGRPTLAPEGAVRPRIRVDGPVAPDTDLPELQTEGDR